MGLIIYTRKEDIPKGMVVTRDVKILADCIGIYVEEYSKRGTPKEPEKFVLFDIEYAKAKTLEEMLWTKEKDMVPLAIYPGRYIIFGKKMSLKSY